MMRREKGQRTFINAAAKVLSLVSDARFVIVGGGGGSYVDRLHEKIRRTFPQRPVPVIITGYREDLSQVMAALDFVVVPSLQAAVGQDLLADPALTANLAGAGLTLARRELSFGEKAECLLESYLKATDRRALDNRASAHVRARVREPFAPAAAR